MCVTVYCTGQLLAVTLPSGKRYQLQYDNSSRLTSLITPSQRRHEFQRLIMPGIDRLLYCPSHLNDSYIVDYDTLGRPLTVLYPLRHRRVTYKYTKLDADVFYDASHVRHRTTTYADYTLSTSTVENFSDNCSCVIQRTDNVSTTAILVTLTGCLRHHHPSDTKSRMVRLNHSLCCVQGVVKWCHISWRKLCHS